MKNKKSTQSQNVQRSQLLGRPAGPIIYVFIAKSLMYYSKIALSAERDATIKQNYSCQQDAQNTAKC